MAQHVQATLIPVSLETIEDIFPYNDCCMHVLWLLCSIVFTSCHLRVVYTTPAPSEFDKRHHGRMYFGDESHVVDRVAHLSSRALVGTRSIYVYRVYTCA